MIMTNGTDNSIYDIFISYRTTHVNWVETLADNLKAQNYQVFLDRWELIPGQRITNGIYDALNHSRCAVLVATPNASDSGWVQDELAQMIQLKNTKKGFFFIPVIMGEFPDLPFIENVLAVDFGNGAPETYRHAFHRLLCGIKQQSPGSTQIFNGKLQFPETTAKPVHSLVSGERSFLDQVFTQLESGLPLMILAQADTHTQRYSTALRQQAETQHGSDNVFHLCPPNSSRADNAAYFSRLAKQCQFDSSIAEVWQWGEALATKLDKGQTLFLLVSGFESGADESRAELAGELRSLYERHPNLRLVMMGGKRLAALKYAQGDMSLLNMADELMIPELIPADLHTIFGQLYPQLNLSAEQLQSLLTFTGGHPRLLHHCLQAGADCVDTCKKILQQSPLTTQLFIKFRQLNDLEPLCTLLNEKSFGRFDPWPIDELLRKLYWQNLLTHREGQCVWRSEFIRQTGKQALQCSQ